MRIFVSALHPVGSLASIRVWLQQVCQDAVYLYTSGSPVLGSKTPSLFTFGLQALYSLCSRLYLSTTSTELHSFSAGGTVKHALTIQRHSALPADQSAKHMQLIEQDGMLQCASWGYQNLLQHSMPSCGTLWMGSSRGRQYQPGKHVIPDHRLQGSNGFWSAAMGFHSGLLSWLGRAVKSRQDPCSHNYYNSRRSALELEHHPIVLLRYRRLTADHVSMMYTPRHPCHR